LQGAGLWVVKIAFLDSFATNLAPFLYKLKTDFISDYQNIVSAVQTVAPYFQDFDFNIEGDFSPCLEMI
jgi:hypothetical protein